MGRLSDHAGLSHRRLRCQRDGSPLGRGATGRFRPARNRELPPVPCGALERGRWNSAQHTDRHRADSFRGHPAFSRETGEAAGRGAQGHVRTDGASPPRRWAAAPAGFCSRQETRAGVHVVAVGVHSATRTRPATRATTVQPAVSSWKCGRSSTSSRTPPCENRLRCGPVVGAVPRLYQCEDRGRGELVDAQGKCRRLGDKPAPVSWCGVRVGHRHPRWAPVARVPGCRPRRPACDHLRPDSGTGYRRNTCGARRSALITG